MDLQKILGGDKPYSASISACDVFARHAHTDIELQFCLDGEYGVSVGKDAFTVKEGDLVLVSPMAPHELFSRGRPETKYLLIEAGPILLGDYFRPISSKGFPSPIVRPDRAAYGELLSLLYETADLIDGDAQFSDLTVRGNICKIFACILRDFVDNENSDLAKSLRAVYSVGRTIDLIRGHYAEEITLERAAAEADYSKSNFCKVFRETTGKTFHETLNAFRIGIAESLLTGTDLSLDEIAWEVGFADARSLCRVFYASHGTSPGAFRRSKRNAGK